MPEKTAEEWDAMFDRIAVWAYATNRQHMGDTVRAAQDHIRSKAADIARYRGYLREIRNIAINAGCPATDPIGAETVLDVSWMLGRINTQAAEVERLRIQAGEKCGTCEGEWFIECVVGQRDAGPLDPEDIIEAKECPDCSGTGLGAVSRQAARIAALEKCLMECAEDLAQRLEDRYRPGDSHPDEFVVFKMRMAPVLKARALLGGE